MQHAADIIEGIDSSILDVISIGLKPLDFAVAQRYQFDVCDSYWATPDRPQPVARPDANGKLPKDNLLVGEVSRLPIDLLKDGALVMTIGSWRVGSLLAKAEMTRRQLPGQN